MGCEGYLVLSCRVYTASNVSLPTASSMGRYNDNIAYIMCDMLWTIELSFNLMRLFVGRWSPIIFHWLFFNQKHTKHGRGCMQNNQLPTKSRVELEDNSYGSG